MKGRQIWEEEEQREINVLNNTVWGWRGGSLAKNTDSSCRGTGFDSQYRYDGLQLSVIPAPGGSDKHVEHR